MVQTTREKAKGKKTLRGMEYTNEGWEKKEKKEKEDDAAAPRAAARVSPRFTEQVLGPNALKKYSPKTCENA
jgi:hypothetical protein